MRIEEYKEGDELKIIELFELVFGRPMSLVQWKWRFELNPAGKHLIRLMWVGDKLVGHYAVSPVSLMIDGVPVKSVLSLTTMTHPDYTGNGIFKKLASALYFHLEFEYGSQAIWGFPNGNSHYGFIKNLEWKDVSVIPTLSVDSKLLPMGTGEINNIDAFTTVHSDLLSKEPSKYPISVQRSTEYLNWRYVQKPSVDYKIFERVENEIVTGVVVVKLYQVNQSKVDLNITELYLNDYSKIGMFMADVLSQIGSEIENVTMWRNVNDSNYLHFERMGFKPSLPLTYLGIRATDSIKELSSSLNNWYYSFGDSDIY
jgi:hypothetical protein